MKLLFIISKTLAIFTAGSIFDRPLSEPLTPEQMEMIRRVYRDDHHLYSPYSRDYIQGDHSLTYPYDYTHPYFD